MRSAASAIAHSKSIAEANERRILRVLEKGGVDLTADEISDRSKISRAATFQRLKSLLSRGLVVELDARKPRSGKGCTAILWRIVDGAIEEFDLQKERAAIRSEAITAPVFRHPQDIAFFGDYRRAA
jgi:predicted ArsR family transcriptional regulator